MKCLVNLIFLKMCIFASKVGQKSRRGSYGADFARIGSEGQVRIVSSRPGQRLWLSDCQGTVQQTLMYKVESIIDTYLEKFAKNWQIFGNVPNLHDT